jgi:hypothetical protein
MNPSLASAQLVNVSNGKALRQDIQDQRRQGDSINGERRQADASDETHEELDAQVGNDSRYDGTERELPPGDRRFAGY